MDMTHCVPFLLYSAITVRIDIFLGEHDASQKSLERLRTSVYEWGEPEKLIDRISINF
jgi:hypothetical protein